MASRDHNCGLTRPCVAITSADGYYIIPALVQGRYYVRVSPEQRKRFGLKDPGMREVTVRSDGKFVNGNRLPADKVIDQAACAELL